MTDDKLLGMAHRITSTRHLELLTEHLGGTYDENLKTYQEKEQAALRILRSWLRRQSDRKSAYRKLSETLRHTDLYWLL